MENRYGSYVRHLTLATIAIFGLGGTAASGAELQERISPALGERTTATVGTPIWQHYRFVGRPGVVVEASVAANWGRAEIVDLSAGSALVVIRDKKLKACASETVVFGVRGWEDCLIDLDDDGRFDRVSFNDVGGSKQLVPPVPYKKMSVEMKGAPGDQSNPNFKKEIIFSGGAQGTLALTYREFINDLARPAFTESLSLPLGQDFPQRIAVKDHVFELVSLDGMGLTYFLVK